MTTRDVPWDEGTPCWLDAQVDDPQAAAEFYSQLFGWEIADTGPDFGHYQMASLDGRAVAGIGGKQGADLPSVWSTYLATDDVEAAVERVSSAGGTVMMPPMDVGSMGRMTFAVDPAGATSSAFGPLRSAMASPTPTAP